ncbi:hypothetical protein EMIHUDRAFT_448994, partial [Emiliania huxleyi CCMP1516]|uniref:Uncharacterized protein n=2 Tax=Emiliania huxleyi TaxID=2903 RepID=A0A0D3KQR8_EMIH1
MSLLICTGLAVALVSPAPALHSGAAPVSPAPALHSGAAPAVQSTAPLMPLLSPNEARGQLALLEEDVQRAGRRAARLSKALTLNRRARAEAKREEEEQVIRRVLNQTEAIATRLDETSARGAASMRRARAYRATLRRRLRSAVESERSQESRAETTAAEFEAAQAKLRATEAKLERATARAEQTEALNRELEAQSKTSSQAGSIRIDYLRHELLSARRAAREARNERKAAVSKTKAEAEAAASEASELLSRLRSAEEQLAVRESDYRSELRAAN